VFRGFTELATWIAEHLKVESAILDGEIACIDDDGPANELCRLSSASDNSESSLPGGIKNARLFHISTGPTTGINNPGKTFGNTFAELDAHNY